LPRPGVELKRVSRRTKGKIQAQYIAKRQEFMRRSPRDQASIADDAISIFEGQWDDVTNRMRVVPGKSVLAALRAELADAYAVNLTDHRIVSEFRDDEVPTDLRTMLDRLDRYRIGG
jgi:hypothetical protein